MLSKRDSTVVTKSELICKLHFIYLKKHITVTDIVALQAVESSFTAIFYLKIVENEYGESYEPAVEGIR